jgi:hypothetical protein
MVGMERMTAGNIPIKTLEKLVKESLKQNPVVFERLAEL